MRPRPLRRFELGLSLGCCLLGLAGCNTAGKPVIRPPANPALAETLRSTPTHPADDYWTEELGHYFSGEVLQNYWLSPEDSRFDSFGYRFLELSLREELLSEYRATLLPTELRAFCRAPDYDSSLSVILGSEAKRRGAERRKESPGAGERGSRGSGTTGEPKGSEDKGS